MSNPFGGNPRVLFNDGEALEYGDLNNMQAYERSSNMDNMWARNLQSAMNNGVANTSALYCMGISGRPTIASNTLRSAAGTIMQTASTIAGDATAGPSLLAYTLSTNEISLSTAGGAVFPSADGTQDRIDFVCVKITSADGGSESRDFKDAITDALSTSSVSKKRGTALATPVVVSGSLFTASGTPTYPTVPSGYVVWAGLYRAAGTGNTIVSGNILDYRVPNRFGSIWIPGYQSTYVPGGNNLVIGNYGTIYFQAGAFSSVNVWVPFPVQCARLLNVTPHYFASNANSTVIGVIKDSDTSSTGVNGNGFSFSDSSFRGNQTFFSQGNYVSPYTDNFFNSSSSVPLWGSGTNSQSVSGAIVRQAALQVSLGGTADYFKGVRFDYAY